MAGLTAPALTRKSGNNEQALNLEVERGGHKTAVLT